MLMPKLLATPVGPATSAATRRAFWLSAIVLGLVGCMALLGVNNLIYRNFPNRPDHVDLVVSILVAALTLAVLERQQAWLDRRLPWADGIGRRFAAQLGLAALCMLLPALLDVGWHLASNLLLNYQGQFLRLQDLAVLTGVTGTLVALTVLLNLGFFLMQRWRESSLEAERYRKENVEFRFEMLRNQVNPHFLFNSLNTLGSLVYQDPDTASGFVRELARVYRYVLESGERELTTLEQELSFLDAFLYLIRIRYAEGIQVEVSASAQARQAQLPPLTLQLLVENAIKHNVVSASRPLKIRIEAAEDSLCVTNTLQPKIMPEAGTHTGLSNIRNRYSYLTQRPIQIQNGPDVFAITLPLLQPNG